MTPRLGAADPRTLLVVDAGHHHRSRTAALASEVTRACFATLTGSELAQDRWTTARVHLRDHGHDLLDALVLGRRPSAVDEIVESTCGADALALVSPCHNASLSALAKLYLDVLPRGALEGLPVVIAIAGASTRHTLVGELVVRPMLTTLGARPVATCLYAAEEDWLPPLCDNETVPQVNSALAGRIDRAAHDLAGAVDEILSTRRLGHVGSPREWRKRASLTV